MRQADGGGGSPFITLTGPVIERPIGVLTKPGHELSAAAQVLFDIFRDEAAKGRFPTF